MCVFARDMVDNLIGAWKPQKWEEESDRIADEESKWGYDVEKSTEENQYEPLIVTYLKPIFANPNETVGPRTTPVKMVQENVGHLLNHEQCTAFLKRTYPFKTFTPAEIRRCYNVLLVVTRKATQIDGMTAKRLDVCFEHYYTNHGSFTQSRCNLLLMIFGANMPLFVCYDIDNDEASGWPEGRNAKSEWPSFTLKELLEDDEKYNVFRSIWDAVPDFEQTYCQLRAVFPKDVIEVIVKFL